MKNLIQSIEQLGWSAIILYWLILTLIVLFVELHDKKQKRLFLNGRWVENDYDPIGFRIVFAIVAFILGLSLFFIIKFFIK